MLTTHTRRCIVGGIVVCKCKYLNTTRNSIDTCTLICVAAIIILQKGELEETTGKVKKTKADKESSTNTDFFF